MSPPRPQPPPEPPRAETIPFAEAPIHAPVAVSVGLTLPEPGASPAGQPPAWQEELSQRVESFRRRRGRLRGSGDSSSNLEFDFDESSADEPVPTAEIISEGHTPQAPGIDIELGGPVHPRVEPAGLDSLHLEPEGLREGVLDASELDSDEPGPPKRRRPVEFVLDSMPRHPDPDPQPAPIEAHRAPMRRRFLGGIIDATVLLVATGVFALIFWRAGGRMSPHPLNLMVVGFITLFLVLSYFGVFTALTSTTPGLLWMGLEVRNFAGGAPTLRQSLWRAFGYLVSASALLLGFVWALFDSDGLTWHDRMSDTFLTMTDSDVEGRKLTVESR